jgi:hypothetical protein
LAIVGVFGLILTLAYLGARRLKYKSDRKHSNR